MAAKFRYADPIHPLSASARAYAALAATRCARFVSRQEDSYAMKVAAALRNQFGGHAVKKGT